MATSEVAPQDKARLFVITGPSGVGKGTLIRELCALVDRLDLSVSVTTRPPRPGELDGIHYHFLSNSQFQERVDNGDFIEHAVYAGNSYGTLKSEVLSRLALGRSVLLEIELQGARQIREALPDAVQIFIDPPSFETLKQRLVGRGTDSQQQIQQRLSMARREMDAKSEFEHIVENDDLQQAVDKLATLIEGARSAPTRKDP